MRKVVYDSTTMEILEKLFGTTARVKLMRLFLFNLDTAYSVETIMERTKEVPRIVKKELALLASINLITKKKVISKIGDTKKKLPGWVLNQDFMYLNELKYLLLNTKLIGDSDMIKRFKKSGRIKLIILSGLFIQNTDSRLDLFIVGDGIKKGSIENVVKTLEAEIGKDLRYVWLSTEEFNYRVAMYDKLVRDILDFPHEKILNRFNTIS